MAAKNWTSAVNMAGGLSLDNVRKFEPMYAYKSLIQAFSAVEKPGLAPSVSSFAWSLYSLTSGLQDGGVHQGLYGIDEDNTQQQWHQVQRRGVEERCGSRQVGESRRPDEAV
ncbi:hypothetical protein MBANPS3_006231 [Mucor bainieri]